MISFVYFDLGGVVISDFSGTNKWQILKQEWGITPEKDDEFEKCWQKFESDLCNGKIRENLIPLASDYPKILNDFASRFETNKSIWPVVEEIQLTCKVGLLTNMYPHMLDAIKKRHLMPNTVWDVVIDSSLVGFSKPDPRIYELAQSKADFSGSEFLFVENSLDNLKPAQDLGWQTFLYNSANPAKSSSDLLKFFRDHLTS